MKQARHLVGGPAIHEETVAVKELLNGDHVFGHAVSSSFSLARDGTKPHSGRATGGVPTGVARSSLPRPLVGKTRDPSRLASPRRGSPLAERVQRNQGGGLPRAHGRR